MGLLSAVAGDPCPYLGAPRGFPFVLGGSEALAAAVVGEVTGLDSFAAGVPVSIAITVLGWIAGLMLFRRMGAGVGPAMVATTIYATMPFTLGIQIFLGTGTGFILLPAYLLVDTIVLRWLLDSARSRLPAPSTVAGIAVLVGYTAVRLWSAFLDGYTFVMSALAAAVILAAVVIERRPRLLRLAAAVAVLTGANLVAVGLYLRAAHGVPVEAGAMGLYRGWGNDLVTLLKPSNQTRWAAELGAAYPRADLWGDFTSTAWNYFGYALAGLALVGVVAALRRRDGLTFGLAIVAVVAAVLSLGASLKLNAAVPPDVLAQPATGRLQPPGQAGAVELPWQWVFELPGIDGIRYPYRWSVLTRLLSLGFAALAVTRLLARRSWFAVTGVLLMMILVIEQWPNRSAFATLQGNADRVAAGIVDDVVPHVRRVTDPGMRVVFVDGTPVANEYLVNPIATLAGVTSYNLGGDKNYLWAREEWPASVSNLIAMPSGRVEFADVLAALDDGADAVVFLDTDLVASINSWPVPANSAAFEPAIAQARASGALTVRESGGIVAVSPR
jgi:hypothetical protein